MKIKSRTIGKIKREFINDETILKEYLTSATYYESTPSANFSKEVKDNKIIFYIETNEEQFIQIESKKDGNKKFIPVNLNYDDIFEKEIKNLKQEDYKFLFIFKALPDKERHEYIIDIID